MLCPSCDVENPEGAKFCRECGQHVNLAARIAAQASGGEIVVSSLLKELTASGGDISFGSDREGELKGLSGTQQIYTVEWN